MTTPSKIYYVEVLPGGERLARGGKIFTTLSDALDHEDSLTRLGVKARTMVLENPVWRQVEDIDF